MLPVWGAYIWRGLYTEGLIFGNFMVLHLGDLCSVQLYEKKMFKICNSAELGLGKGDT